MLPSAGGGKAGARRKAADETDRSHKSHRSPRSHPSDPQRATPALPARKTATTDDTAYLDDLLHDPIRRLTSGEFYKIKPADGSGLQPFIPRPEQLRVIRAIWEEGCKRLIIPKARRLGMSTVLGILCADALLFHSGWQGSLVDQTKADASMKLSQIVKTALDHFPRGLPKSVLKSNASELSLDVITTGSSSFFAGMNARGGSNDFLWISEWGPIQLDDPKRSAEIRSGALPSARHGTIVIETTWKGGKGGDLWEIMSPSLTNGGSGGADEDWRVMFFPWWVDPRNEAPGARMDAEAEAYFAKIEPRLKREEIELTEGQRRWWARERRAQGVFMARENPTFLDECWASPVPGAIYAEAIERARAEGRIAPMPVDGSNLVHTSWDLGAPENTVVWYWQVVGREIRAIDCDRGEKGTLTQRVASMLAKGYQFGKHYLPHDSAQTERSGSSFLGELARAGLPASSLVPVPRTADVWIGINHALQLFPSLAFRSPQCDDGLGALGAYRSRRSGTGPGTSGTSDEPVHDWASHTADALRVMAEAHHAGMIHFKHTAAQPRPQWHEPHERKRPRLGMKPIKVAAGW